MKTFAVFFETGLITGKLVGACGDRSVVKLDGRQSQLTHEFIAEDECRKRKYVAWQLVRGSSLLNCKPFTPIVPLYY
jgi:hypothetical protein